MMMKISATVSLGDVKILNNCRLYRIFTFKTFIFRFPQEVMPQKNALELQSVL